MNVCVDNNNNWIYRKTSFLFLSCLLFVNCAQNIKISIPFSYFHTRNRVLDNLLTSLSTAVTQSVLFAIVLFFSTHEEGPKRWSDRCTSTGGCWRRPASRRPATRSPRASCSRPWSPDTTSTYNWRRRTTVDATTTTTPLRRHCRHLAVTASPEIWAASRTWSSRSRKEASSTVRSRVGPSPRGRYSRTIPTRTIIHCWRRPTSSEWCCDWPPVWTPSVGGIEQPTTATTTAWDHADGLTTISTSWWDDGDGRRRSTKSSTQRRQSRSDVYAADICSRGIPSNETCEVGRLQWWTVVAVRASKRSTVDRVSYWSRRYGVPDSFRTESVAVSATRPWRRSSVVWYDRYRYRRPYCLEPPSSRPCTAYSNRD